MNKSIYFSLKRIKYITEINKYVLPESTQRLTEIKYVDIGNVSYNEGIGQTQVFTFSKAPSRARRLTELGDVIVSTVRTYLKAIAPIDSLEKTNYVYSTGFAILSPYGITPSYLKHAIRSDYFTNKVDKASIGISYPSINSAALGSIKIPVPPVSEQTRIAKFLDEKCVKIDKSIAQKERLIELLEERKQIIIQEAVTKGLPYAERVKAGLPAEVKMKDSGIEWIGKIPENWKVSPGFTVFKNVKQSNKGLKEETVLSLSYGKIIIKPKNKLFGLVPESFETYQIVKPNDVIVRCMDLQNDKTSLRFGIVENLGIISSAYLNLRIISEVLPEYLHRYFHVMDKVKEIYKYGSGLRQNLSFNDFKRMPILIFSQNEQYLIIDYLSKIELKINSLKKNQLSQILKLKEYKATLIDSLVTGKVRVMENGKLGTESTHPQNN
ncbi:MAG: type I restriction enzyme S subunit [Halioglobus sp.]|jgi:type I restriction enzyme S subunit